LFWNLGKNSNEKFLKDIVIEHSVDLLILSEFQKTDLPQVISELKNEYCLYKGYGGCDKVVMIARNNIDITIRREQDRYTVYSCNVVDCSYIIAGIHLPANPHSTPEDRKCIIRDLVIHIKELENELDNSNTIVIGDFNASPFDAELIQKDSFNAVLYKDLILRTENVTCNRKQYRRFYNPMVNYISETSHHYGSFYYGNGVDSLYWFCYDQVIVRKPLVNLISDIQYFRKIKNESLLKDILPNNKISDHLPLMVQFERMVQHE
jgi:exonuclease III